MLYPPSPPSQLLSGTYSLKSLRTPLCLEAPGLRHIESMFGGEVEAGGIVCKCVRGKRDRSGARLQMATYLLRQMRQSLFESVTHSLTHWLWLTLPCRLRSHRTSAMDGRASPNLKTMILDSLALSYSPFHSIVFDVLECLQPNKILLYDFDNRLSITIIRISNRCIVMEDNL